MSPIVHDQAQHADVAKSAFVTNAMSPTSTPAMAPTEAPSDSHHHDGVNGGKESTMMPPPHPSKTVVGRALGSELHHDASKLSVGQSQQPSKDGVGSALTDTPISTAPSSPQMPPRWSSHPGTPKLHATTLNIPGLTKSKVSPDGRIPQRDVGSKLVIVMVGLPARGKSYITKKLSRYLNWLQHDTQIFNVGERRRVAAGSPQPPSKDEEIEDKLRVSVSNLNINNKGPHSPDGIDDQGDVLPPPLVPAQILVNGEVTDETRIERPHESSSPKDGDAKPMAANADSPADSPPSYFPPKNEVLASTAKPNRAKSMDQSASFFDPQNALAVKLREQVALATLDELLDYILDQDGSIGILDATNSTLQRRKAVIDRIRARAGPELNVLFLESACVDEDLLESNMRLKLSGPDYKHQNADKALKDFKKRVSLYEKSYVPLGEYEERNNMAYIQMIDVGRKIVSHQTNGFLSSQVVYYLLNFNLSPRQIWITRHGESLDDVSGRIGGDADLSENGVRYAKALTRFIDHQRAEWESYQKTKAMSTHFPPLPGDLTPPNPRYGGAKDEPARNFCVWTSMLKRTIQTAQYFNDEEYDVKEMKMLDELNAGRMEGMTYEEIRQKYPEEYALRRSDKLAYRYPGPGGEGYLDVINRLRAVIVEVERTTDHVLLVSHRSVARVLLAYFRGLKRDEVADLDVPLGVVYMLEPKPYGVEVKVYRYNPKTDWFDYLPNYEMRQATYF